MNRDKSIENLRSAREKRVLTQKQVSEVLGISNRTYSKWETGEPEPGIELRCRLGEFYGVGPGRARISPPTAARTCGSKHRTAVHERHDGVMP